MFLLCLGNSLATKEELAANGGYVLFPSNPTFESYNVVLSGGVVTRAAVVSVVITLVGTALSLLCTVALAYGLSRPGTVAGKPLLLIVLGTFLFTPGIIPNYLVIQELGMIDTYGTLIAPIMLNAFNIVVVRAFFQGIPDELHEAARLDGAGDPRILLRIVLPLSKAVIAVVGMFYAVQYWNNFFNAMLYINDGSKLPLLVVLRSYVLQGDTFNAKALGVATLPSSTAESLGAREGHIEWVFGGPDSVITRDVVARQGYALRLRLHTVGNDRQVHIGTVIDCSAPRPRRPMRLCGSGPGKPPPARTPPMPDMTRQMPLTCVPVACVTLVWPVE
ncbi:carbohydrate ABC transporter permease [Streptomyces montanus]|uniref:carbohydrate ABC transporter permease n=1 Tax=Streptomyces montanus TaxID=2580423 RepID=UPI001FEAD5E7|nr:carbohydrate ABC transporter permease [Streptomyces montanus]